MKRLTNYRITLILLLIFIGLLAVIPCAFGSNSVVYDSNANEFFLYDNTNPTYLLAISAQNGSVIANISLGFNLYNIAYASERNQIIATNSHSNFIALVSDSTNSINATVVTGTWPVAAIYDSGRDLIYVSNFALNLVTTVDKSNEVVARISVPHPIGLTYDSDKGLIYILTEQSGIVQISDTSNFVTNLTIGGFKAIIYDSNKSEVWTTNGVLVFAISDKDNSVVANVTGRQRGLNYFNELVFNPVKGEIFAFTSGSLAPTEVTIISDQNNSVVQKIKLPVSYPSYVVGADYIPSEGVVFVVNDGKDNFSFISENSSYFNDSIPEFDYSLLQVILLMLIGIVITTAVKVRKVYSKHALPLE